MSLHTLRRLVLVNVCGGTMIKECPLCTAKWIGEQLYWSTGKAGCPHDLAGLLCNDINNEPVSYTHLTLPTTPYV